MLKKLSALSLVALFVSFSANAGPRWYVSVEDDLFSDTGKKVTLVSSGNREKLVFDCENNKLSFAFLMSYDFLIKNPGFIIKNPLTFNDSRPVKLVIKVDDNESFIFNAAYGHREINMFSMLSMSVKFEYSDKAVFLPAFEQFESAKSKILVGLESGDSKYTSTIGVAGSTAATKRFLKSCGFRD